MATKSRAEELTDEQWALIEPLLPELPRRPDEPALRHDVAADPAIQDELLSHACIVGAARVKLIQNMIILQVYTVPCQ